MHDAIRTPDQKDSLHVAPDTKKPFARPALENLGIMHAVTRGPGMGTEDAVIFAPGGDPSDDPS